MVEREIEYLENRAEREIELAEQSSIEAVTSAHTRLSQLYRERVATMKTAPPPAPSR